MGFAVDEQRDDFPMMDDDEHAEVRWDAGYAAWSRAVRDGRVVARYALREAACWSRIVDAIPEGGSALLVSHGGVIEAGVAACLPAGEHTTLEVNCDYCEGVAAFLQWSGLGGHRNPAGSRALDRSYLAPDKSSFVPPLPSFKGSGPDRRPRSAQLSNRLAPEAGDPLPRRSRICTRGARQAKLLTRGRCARSIRAWALSSSIAVDTYQAICLRFAGELGNSALLFLRRNKVIVARKLEKEARGGMPGR